MSAFTEAWHRWHEEKDAALADPHGFLAVTALHWLTDRPQRLPGAPGTWSTGPDGPVVVLDPDDDLVLDGVRLTGRHAFGPIPERGGVTAVSGDTHVEVARRGGHDIVRPRHPDHPLRVQFHGTPAYAPDPRWVLAGRYRAFNAPRPTTVGAAVEGLEHVYDAPGEISFTLDGREHTLTAFEGRAPGSLQVLFTDATAGVTTYGAVRSLAVAPPDADGAVVLDLNRATNLPCAYTDLATCPLPPAENRLPVAVEAGERIPYERQPARV
ncbi:DUF1684 domain-containing protein [Modestobacter sp. I12A-02628]|uniref:DUF1684 domain-containing protein n=1 Tax=Goekera deserti TaxID=2497753 RepID=A0A7K3WHU6_9ACTN|nr:DUF1684 domain-containing protein [Goekera deserti]MPQ96554.1 DUF1684 domain-containing protein [Goekera deserti]NDI47133.1 DUF1684 domain-containing protein [Goekera deserti]NEL55469.1 DUF1684 domain-containing protein [Goekera deserti]